MDSVGEGEGGKIWENGIETCKISCMKRDASPGSMHDTGWSAAQLLFTSFVYFWLFLCFIFHFYFIFF